METFAHLIGETGRLLGIDGLEPDAEGVVEFASDDANIVLIHSEEVDNVFLMTATVIPLPPSSEDSILAALKANHGFKATKGCTVSLDSEGGRLVLSECLPIPPMTPESLISALERFTSVLLALRPVLEANAPLSSILDAVGDDGTEEDADEENIELGDETVTLRHRGDGTYIASSELCTLPEDGRYSILHDLAQANYLFEGTAGATFSIDPETNGIWLQQRVWPQEVDLVAGGNGIMISRRIAVFADKVAEWKRTISGSAEFSSMPDHLDGLANFIKV